MSMRTLSTVGDESPEKTGENELDSLKKACEKDGL